MTKLSYKTLLILSLVSVFFALGSFWNVQIAQAAVNLTPGQDVQAIVASNPEGTEFIFSPGIYRMQAINPKNNQIFTGQAGAILSGARVLTSFTQEGSYWVAAGQTQEGQRHPTSNLCSPGYPRCGHPDDFFINDQPLLAVDSLNAVTTGKYYFDYQADKIYFLDNPTGKKVEASVARSAFWGNATNITIQGLTIEKYAIPAQMGAIGDQYPGDGWIIKNNEVRLNHGAGIRVANRAQVLNNNIHDNGQEGMAGVGDDILVEGNEIHHNAWYSGITTGWEGGAFKFALTNRLTIRGNNSHHNNGAGMWTDISNINTLIENNTVTDNGIGIFHEVSYKATIKNNTVKRNGSYTTDLGWIWPAQILIAASRDVEVYNNTIESDSNGFMTGIALIQQNRSSDDCRYGPCHTINNYIHHNMITITGNGTHGTTGGVQDYFNFSVVPDIFAPSSNNRFDYNSYVLPSLTSQSFFTWNNEWLNWSTWRSAGLEANGCASTNNSCPNPFGPTPLAGDLNVDHIVNSLDWSYMNNKWFTNDPVADLDHNGLVNGIDFSTLNSNWFKTW